jgi:hypothetical protein
MLKKFVKFLATKQGLNEALVEEETVQMGLG